MNSNSILKADVIDIIFEHRNKAYGAYALRKFYNNRLYKAIAIMFVFAGMVFLFSAFKKEKVLLTVTTYVDPEFSAPPLMPDKPKVPDQPQKPVTAQPKVATQKVPSGNIVITKDNLADKIDDIKPGIAPGNENRDGKKDVPFVPEIPEGPVSGGTPAPPAPPAPPAIDKITPMNAPEVMPAYPGGMEALRKFLQKNLSNPQDIDGGGTVSVKIRFVVGFDGNLKGFETIEDGGSAFNNEVIRVLKKMPQWIPGKTRGENVSVYYTIPVKFTAAE